VVPAIATYSAAPFYSQCDEPGTRTNHPEITDSGAERAQYQALDIAEPCCLPLRLDPGVQDRT